MLNRGKKQNTAGFTLIEVLVGTAVFMILAISVYQTYTAVLSTVNASRTKITASALANEQFEIIRNLPYGDVGTTDGAPHGKILKEQNLTRDGKVFTVKTTIRSVDDPFDGTISNETNNDLSPADYKITEIEVSCTACKNYKPLVFTTQVGPKDLESESTNGSLFVKVFDTNGEPISQANVHIENNDVFPPIEIDDVTNNEGLLQVVDTTPSVESYQITVSKPGYSTEKTYKAGESQNPNPIKANATVVIRKLTQISFPMSYTGDISINSLDQNCNPISDTIFSFQGTKLIGTNPDVLKFNATSTTDNLGEKILTDLDFDYYNIKSADAAYNSLGISPVMPMIINSTSTNEVKLVLSPKNLAGLLVTVKDGSASLLSGANVELIKNASSSVSLITGPDSTTECRPEGTAFFTDLDSNNYTLSVSKSGYQNHTETIDINSPWQEKEIILNP